MPQSRRLDLVTIAVNSIAFIALAGPGFGPRAAHEAHAMTVTGGFVGPGSGSSSSSSHSIAGGTGFPAPGSSASAHYVLDSGPGAVRPAPAVTPPPRESTAGFVVSTPRPNPFTSQTALSFQLPRAAEVTLRLYSLPGRLVREIRLGSQSAGAGIVRWDGRDDAGRAMAAGVYFFRFEAGPDHRDGRTVLIR